MIDICKLLSLLVSRPEYDIEKQLEILLVQLKKNSAKRKVINEIIDQTSTEIEKINQDSSANIKKSIDLVRISEGLSEKFQELQDMDQLTSYKIQTMLERHQALGQMMNNILNIIHDTQISIIRNLR